MVAVPVIRPVTTPVEVTVRIVEVLVLQVPPDGVAEIATAPPTHTEVGPLIADGPGITVTVLVAIHPVKP
jgi:hypothetical protein